MGQRSWVIDLDGVIWHEGVPIPGSAGAVAELRRRGDRVLFATNHSAPTRRDLLGRLRACGIPADLCDLRTSADALATLVEPGEHVLAFAGPGVIEAIAQRGEPEGPQRVPSRSDAPFDAVAVGWHADLSLDGLTAAVRAVLDGARLLAANDDALRPTAAGPVPGAGAFVAAVEAATGTTAVRAGKPHPPMTQLLRGHLTEDVVVVGDSVATDGGLAQALGAQFALVLSGVTTATPRDAVGERQLVATDLAAAVAKLA